MKLRGFGPLARHGTCILCDRMRSARTVFLGRIAILGVSNVMRNKLQYVYSITVFVGVLLSSYMMMERDQNNRSPLQIMQSNPQNVRATVVDPVVNQLFEFEESLSNQFSDDSDSTREPLAEDSDSSPNP